MLKMFLFCFFKSQAVNSTMICVICEQFHHVVYYRLLSNGFMTQDQINLDVSLKLK